MRVIIGHSNDASYLGSRAEIWSGSQVLASRPENVGHTIHHDGHQAVVDLKNDPLCLACQRRHRQSEALAHVDDDDDISAVIRYARNLLGPMGNRHGLERIDDLAHHLNGDGVLNLAHEEADEILERVMALT